MVLNYCDKVLVSASRVKFWEWNARCFPKPGLTLENTSELAMHLLRDLQPMTNMVYRFAPGLSRRSNI
ncbi:hypothetical protein TNCV_1145871 [Trichonephila clavipes]|nr:hypothetical protein TNCV_1145871 [Trichonephila clavipes]